MDENRVFEKVFVIAQAHSAITSFASKMSSKIKTGLQKLIVTITNKLSRAIDNKDSKQMKKPTFEDLDGLQLGDRRLPSARFESFQLLLIDQFYAQSILRGVTLPPCLQTEIVENGYHLDFSFFFFFFFCSCMKEW